MLLNHFESLLLKSSLRRPLHRYVDFGIWKQLNSKAVLSGKALEVGCGRGFGIEILARRPYEFDSLIGVEPDPSMYSLAKKTVDAWPHIKILEGRLSDVINENDLYDFVLCSQVLHHIHNWQAAIQEISCRTKKGGTVFLVESLKSFIQAPFIRNIMRHPQVNRFNKQELLEELAASGFGNIRHKSFCGVFLWVVARKVV